MKQESQIEVNDRILRRAMAGEVKALICVHRETSTVITNMGPRPTIFSNDYAEKFEAYFEKSGTHFCVEVDPSDPYQNVFLEETDKGDRWVYRPVHTLSVQDLALDHIYDDTPIRANKTIVVRNSELTDAVCLKSYHLKWVKNLRPKRTDPKLTTGTMFHAFQETYEPELADESNPGHLRADYAAQLGFAALNTAHQKFKDTLLESDVEGRLEIDEAWVVATKMCEGYHKWRTIDPVGLSLSPVQQSEATFNLSVGEWEGVEIVLSGTMDGIGVTRVTEDEPSELWLREYKTCKSIADKLKSYRTDKQTRRYVGVARKHGVHFMGVELVLAAKTLPLEDSEYVLKNGDITRDMKKWGKASYDQALRIANLGKFVSPDAKNGLTEKGFHDILRLLKDQPNPFFHVERLYFNDHELDTIMDETLIEAHRLHVTRETVGKYGDRVWTRNPGPMGFNCKSCSVRDLCEMELKGVDTAFHIEEHYLVDNSIHAGKETGDEDD